MKLLSIEDLRMLVGAHRAPCITITTPMHRDPAARAADRRTYLDLVGQAEAAVALSSKEGAALLAPPHELAADPMWEHPLGGLAVFRSRDLAVAFRVPATLPASVAVDDRFHVKALVPLLRAGERYLLLTLAQNHVALFLGTQADLVPVPTPGMPRSMLEALGPEWRTRFLGAHSQGPGHLVFHGHGAPHEDIKSDVVRFFRQVDEGLWPHLRDSHLPLILAGVDYYHPLYRQVSRYPHIAAEGITGNVERDSPAQLLEKVRPIAGRLASAREDEALAGLHHGEPRASTALESIARAAVQGRVRRLLIAEGATVRGRVTDTGALVLHEAGGDRDVIEDLAEAVLIRGGEVMALPRARMPGQHAVAASFRW